jgi:hypothetical protein
MQLMANILAFRFCTSPAMNLCNSSMLSLAINVRRFFYINYKLKIDLRMVFGMALLNNHVK